MCTMYVRQSGNDPSSAYSRKFIRRIQHSFVKLERWKEAPVDIWLFSSSIDSGESKIALGYLTMEFFPNRPIEYILF